MKQIVAMRNFLNVWPFTKDDPDIAGAEVLLTGLEAQVSRIPETNEGTILKQVYTGLGGAWKNTDAPKVLELRATVEKYDQLCAEGTAIIKKKQEKGAQQFLEAWPFALENDPLINDMKQFLVRCENRRERLHQSVKNSMEKRSLKDHENDLHQLREAGGDNPEAAAQILEWQARVEEYDPVLKA